jgi:predicted murein hydrolase (TIGR00659 family)
MNRIINLRVVLQELLGNSVFFGVMISIIGYEIGLFLKKKFQKAIFNPLLISVTFVMVVLVVLGVDYNSYNNGAKYLSYLLTPATVCLAVPLYKQLELLKSNIKAILVGILSGVISSLGSVFLFCKLFNFTHEQYVTLLPKSITTAIGMGVSEELGGIVTITVAVIITTGVIGNILAEIICKVFRINEPIAKGIAIGASSHAIGTAKAMEMGEIEGAMSSLAIAVSGLVTVVVASIFVNFI